MKKEFNGLCLQCQDDEIYSKALTNGLCLNCHYQNEKDLKEMEIECQHDLFMEGY